MVQGTSRGQGKLDFAVQCRIPDPSGALFVLSESKEGRVGADKPGMLNRQNTLKTLLLKDGIQAVYDQFAGANVAAEPQTARDFAC